MIRHSVIDLAGVSAGKSQGAMGSDKGLLVEGFAPIPWLHVAPDTSTLRQLLGCAGTWLRRTTLTC